MKIWSGSGHIPLLQRVITVLWASFLMAGIATGVFFSSIDPLELKYCVDFPDVSRTGAYTIGFLLFWLLTAASGLLSVFLTYPESSEASAADSNGD